MVARKIVLLLVFVNLGFALILITSTRDANAATLPYGQGSSALTIQSTHSKFVNYTGAPAYDSGWESLSIRPDPITVGFNHNLGGNPDNYLVSLECRDNTSLSTYDCTNESFNVNAHWYGLNTTTVTVYVAGGSQPDDVRVRIWRVNTVYLPIVIRNFGAAYR